MKQQIRHIITTLTVSVVIVCLILWLDDMYIVINIVAVTVIRRSVRNVDTM